MRLGPQLPTCIAAGGAGSSGDSLGVEGKRGVLRARCWRRLVFAREGEQFLGRLLPTTLFG